MLRVGVILDSYTAGAWIAKVVEDVQTSGFARVELVILNTPSQSTRSTTHTLAHAALFRVYERWDRKRNRCGDDALAPNDMTSLLREIPAIFLAPGPEGSEGVMPEGTAQEIRKSNLDVLFQFGSNVVSPAILGSARYGVWSFHFGETSGSPTNPPLFWELFDHNPVSESSLRIANDSEHGNRIIYQSYATTEQTSLYRSRNPIYWKTAEFAMRRLRDLHLHGIASIQSLPSYREQKPQIGGVRRGPGNFQMIFFMLRHLCRAFQARIASRRAVATKKWCICIRDRNKPASFDNPSDYRLWTAPEDRFYADPFLIERGGKTLLFFEDFRYSEGRAVISHCELGPDGAPGEPSEVLRCPFHLSYPFLFEDEGETYMIPESRDQRTVDLYRATDFPTTWTFEATLLKDIYAVDATIHRRDGKLFLFAGVSDGRYSTCDELCIFFADTLKGPWTPHPRNPVLSDVRQARPAGALFYDQGRLIRPSQDCSKAYGYALVFSEVITLTETDYEERPISRLYPESIPGNWANHTYNRTARFEVIDRDMFVKAL